MRRLNRQEQIYVEAARLFVEKGFAGASMSDIAQAVGMTKAGLYHFVENKEELLFTIMSYGMDVLFEQVAEPARLIADPRARLEAIVRLHVRNICEGGTDNGNPVTIVVNEATGLNEDRRQQINTRKNEFVGLIRGALEALRADGRLRDDIEIAVAAFSIIGMVTWSTHWHRPGGRLSIEQIAAQISALALNAVLKP